MKRHHLVIVGFALIILSSCSTVRSVGPTTSAPNVRQTAWTSDDPTLGRPDAPLKLVVFSDFQCPYCAGFIETIDELKDDWIATGELTVQYREFLLKGHKNSLTSSQAAGAAGKQDNFWEMAHRLYETQSVWAGSDNPYLIYESYAKELGLNLKQFKIDYESADVAQEAINDLEDGQDLGVTGTPTSFLNGKMIRGYWKKENFEKILNEAKNGNKRR